ncbi:biotin--[acetyl-CoA-carboxylase] ligase [Sphingomonas sp. SUN039]|uniref:biotin--[acetyl-CoA-carboxylase] ligase n=1 Tax=Sphingomonas sp. SUN039 TaxID=2937787 RepID=UPI002868E214|nr:biotin--[acetyl-CoA-carboxylase] ligase [Sphingomonas sp. SUN039]
MRVVETGSTNADMLALAASGSVHEGDWLIAERQTAGRGRQGRAWVSPPGNLYASGLVELRAGDPPASTLALIAGLAVVDALGVSGVSLKWPNDVLAGSAKLAGILLERQNDAVVIGVGANLAHLPDLPDRPTMSLAALGVTMSADTAISALVPAFARWLDLWRTAGLPAIRTAWLDRAHPVGTPLAAALPDGTRIEGSFDGLTPDCALQLRLADGTTRVIHAGDVFLI